MNNIWTDFAISYDAVIPELTCYRRKFEKILRDTAGCSLVIDAGCGTGLVSEALVKRGQSVFGFDNNPGMLSQAFIKRETLPESARGLWTITEGDVQDFPSYTPTLADAIVLNNVLFYVPEPKRCLQLCSQHLGPRGRIVLTGPKRRPDIEKIMRLSIEDWKHEERFTPQLEQAFAHHAQLARKLAGEEMMTFFEPETLVDILQSIGFQKVLEASGEDYFGESYYVAMSRA